MAKDNPRKKRADGRRVALKQEHERRYVIERLESSCADVRFAIEELEGAEQAIQRSIDRLRAGFPSKSRKAGK